MSQIVPRWPSCTKTTSVLNAAAVAQITNGLSTLTQVADCASSDEICSNQIRIISRLREIFALSNSVPSRLENWSNWNNGGNMQFSVISPFLAATSELFRSRWKLIIIPILEKFTSLRKEFRFLYSWLRKEKLGERNGSRRGKFIWIANSATSYKTSATEILHLRLITDFHPFQVTYDFPAVWIFREWNELRKLYTGKYFISILLGVSK